MNNYNNTANNLFEIEKGVGGMSIVKKVKLSVTIAIVASIIFSIYSFAQTSEEIRSDFIRLHVIANSDSAFDQELKLNVRDFVLNNGSTIFDGTVNPQNVFLKVPKYLPELEELTEKFIRTYGYDYNVTITLEKEYFTTRTYNTVTLPAGEYTALKVVIGDGSGKNWWCVMFPPMCISAADEQEVLKTKVTENELRLVNKNPQFEVRFKIIELIEEIKLKLNNDDE